MSTGDASINRDAPIMCATAEILANIALRDGDAAEIDAHGDADVIADRRRLVVRGNDERDARAGRHGSRRSARARSFAP